TTKDEKSLSGCIRSQNGSFVLEEKNGKFAKLNSAEDLSAHVGHSVKVRGSWEAGSASSTSSNDQLKGSASASGSESNTASSASSTANPSAGSSASTSNPSSSTSTTA